MALAEALDNPFELAAACAQLGRALMTLGRHTEALLNFKKDLALQEEHSRARTSVVTTHASWRQQHGGSGGGGSEEGEGLEKRDQGTAAVLQLPDEKPQWRPGDDVRGVRNIGDAFLALQQHGNAFDAFQKLLRIARTTADHAGQA